MRRPLPLILLGLLLLFQLQLWFGRGSIPDVWRLRQQYQEQLESNARSQSDIERLRAELREEPLRNQVGHLRWDSQNRQFHQGIEWSRFLL